MIAPSAHVPKLYVTLCTLTSALKYLYIQEPTSDPKPASPKPKTQFILYGYIDPSGCGATAYNLRPTSNMTTSASLMGSVGSRLRVSAGRLSCVDQTCVVIQASAL